MELRRYLAIAWRWSWLFVLGTVLAATAAFIVARGQTPVYQATSTVLLNQPQVTSTGYTDVQGLQQLARTYGQIVTSDVVLDQVAKNAGMTTEELRPLVSATVQKDTALIDVTVQNTDPQLAARLANEVVSVFAEHVRQTTTGDQEAVIRELEKQVEAAQTRVDDRQRLVTRLTAIPVGELTETQRQQLADGQFQLDILRQNLTTLQNQLQTLRVDVAKSSVNVTVPNPARAPESPISPKVGQTTAVGAALGLLLMVAIVLAIEYLDDTIKTGDDVARVAKAPLLGAIPRIRGRRGETKSPLLTNYEGHSHVAEAYRILRTNLEFAHSGRPHQTMLVTSAVPSEGKSVTTANLALMLAQTGRRVLLVDADMRKPTQHFLFEVANTTGLSTLFVMETPRLGGLLRATPVENLSLLTAGPPPPNPSELLSSPRMQEILDLVKAEAEIVVFDSPPLLNVADTAALAARLDGVVLVTDSTRTRSGAVAQAMETLNRAQATVWGVVLNKLAGQGSDSYYYSSSVIDLARKHKVDLSMIRSIGLVSRSSRDVTKYIKQHAKEDVAAVEEPRPLPERRPFHGPRITAADRAAQAAADGDAQVWGMPETDAAARPEQVAAQTPLVDQPERAAADTGRAAEAAPVEHVPAEAIPAERASSEHLPAAAARGVFGEVPRSRPLNGRRVNGTRPEAQTTGADAAFRTWETGAETGGQEGHGLAAHGEDRRSGQVNDQVVTPEVDADAVLAAELDLEMASNADLGVPDDGAQPAAVTADAEAATDLELVAALAAAADAEVEDGTLVEAEAAEESPTPEPEPVVIAGAEDAPVAGATEDIADADADAAEAVEVEAVPEAALPDTTAGGVGWVMLDVDLTGVVTSGRLRNPVLSPLPYVLRAVTRAARRQPAVLGKAAGGDLETADVAVGVTLAGPNGLFTPVIHDADRLAPGEVQMRLQEVENRARDGRLLPWDLIGAEVTLDASGLFDTSVFQPSLEPGQPVKVSLALVQEREGEHGPQTLGTLFLVFDAAALAEPEATRFLEAVRDDLVLHDARQRNGLPWHDPARASAS